MNELKQLGNLFCTRLFILFACYGPFVLCCVVSWKCEKINRWTKYIFEEKFMPQWKWQNTCIKLLIFDYRQEIFMFQISNEELWRNWLKLKMETIFWNRTISCHRYMLGYMPTYIPASHHSICVPYTNWNWIDFTVCLNKIIHKHIISLHSIKKKKK